MNAQPLVDLDNTRHMVYLTCRDPFASVHLLAAALTLEAGDMEYLLGRTVCSDT